MSYNTNRYFIVNAPNPNMAQIFDIVVGEASTQKFSLDGFKVLVKLPVGDETNYGVLATATEYTHEGITAYLSDNITEWDEPINEI